MSPGKETSAFSVESAFVALLSLTNNVRPWRPSSSMRCARPGKVFRQRAMSCASSGCGSESSAAAVGAGVLGVVRAAQRADTGEIGNLGGGSASAQHEARAFDTDIAIGALARRDAHDRVGTLRLCADHRRWRGNRHHRYRQRPCRAPCGKSRLYRRVVLDGAVPVEVVGRHIEQHADGSVEARRQIDLIRRALDDVVATRREGLERQHGGADVAADLRVATRLRAGCAR